MLLTLMSNHPLIDVLKCVCVYIHIDKDQCVCVGVGGCCWDLLLLPVGRRLLFSRILVAGTSTAVVQLLTCLPCNALKVVLCPDLEKDILGQHSMLSIVSVSVCLGNIILLVCCL